jgi:hypothetical protein
MSDGLWLIWIGGFLTGGGATYLGCCLFCRRILREEAELVKYLGDKAHRPLDLTGFARVPEFAKPVKPRNPFWDEDGSEAKAE